MEPKLRLPFNGDFPATFGFGEVSTVETIKQKFSEWGIVGHHGIDYGLPEGTEVLASDTGKVIQSGENGDFGISIILEHSWGQSIYAHLKETKVNVGDEVEAGKLIGLSGKTGAAFGEHLHFGIKLSNTDSNNGYLGFTDPSPYFVKSEKVKPEEKPQVPQPIEIPPQETQPTGEQQTSQSLPPQQPEPKVIEKEVPVEVIKEVKVVDEDEVKKQVDEKLKEKLLENKKKADEARTQRRKDNLNRIVDLAKKKEINNQEVRDLLQVSQSTATDYLTELSKSGRLKSEKKAKATVYKS